MPGGSQDCAKEGMTSVPSGPPFGLEPASAGPPPTHFSAKYGGSEDRVPDPTLLSNLKVRVDVWGSHIPSLETTRWGPSLDLEG